MHDETKTKRIELSERQVNELNKRGKESKEEPVKCLFMKGKSGNTIRKDKICRNEKCEFDSGKKYKNAVENTVNCKKP